MLKKGARAVGLALLFLGLVFLTFRQLFLTQDWSPLWDSLDHLRPAWFGVAAGIMALFFACEGRNLRAALGLFGSPAPYRSCVRYGLTGFFFSAVTPSSSGGQPMAMAVMGRDGQKAAPSALALLTVFLSYQGASFLWAGMGLCLHWSKLTALKGGFAWGFLLGLGLSAGLAIGLIGAVWSPRLLPFFFRNMLHLISRFSPARSEKIGAWGDAQWRSLRRCLGAYRANPKVLAGMLAVAVVQLGAYHSVTLWVLLALGQPWTAPVEMISLQAVLYLAVSSLPLPGAVGISEGAFLALYSGVIASDLLPAAALLSRGVTFYLPVLLSGGFLCLHRLSSRNSAETYLPVRQAEAAQPHHQKTC